MGFAEGFAAGSQAVAQGFRVGIEVRRSYAEMRQVMEDRADKIQWREKMQPQLEKELAEAGRETNEAMADVRRIAQLRRDGLATDAEYDQAQSRLQEAFSAGAMNAMTVVSRYASTGNPYAEKYTRDYVQNFSTLMNQGFASIQQKREQQGRLGEIAAQGDQNVRGIAAQGDETRKTQAEGLEGQLALQDDQQDADAARQAADIEGRLQLQGNEIEATRANLEKELGVRVSEAQAERLMRSFLQRRELDASAEAQKRDIESREREGGLNRQAAKEALEAELGVRVDEGKADRAMQVLLQGRELGSRERMSAADRDAARANLEKELGVRVSERQLDRLQERMLQSKELGSRERISDKDRASSEALAGKERDLRRELQGNEIEAEDRRQGRAIDAEDRRQNRAVQAEERLTQMRADLDMANPVNQTRLVTGVAEGVRGGWISDEAAKKLLPSGWDPADLEDRLAQFDEETRARLENVESQIEVIEKRNKSGRVLPTDRGTLERLRRQRVKMEEIQAARIEEAAIQADETPWEPYMMFFGRSDERQATIDARVERGTPEDRAEKRTDERMKSGDY